ncbi:MAG: cytochrome c oxidase subunit 3 [Legionellaceae bacterium]|nr:cytochrome c oxidase subunit 3 [Legionellaceae bacterium]
MGAHGTYYVPKPSGWPLVGSIGLTTMLVGAASWLHADWYGPYIFTAGLSILVFMMFGWFGQVIYENEKGLYDSQVDRSFRWAMCWFIFSEVCFFAAFFGALFFTRYWSVPILGGENLNHPITHYTLWSDFQATWPLLVNPDNAQFVGAKHGMGAWGLAAINTVILLTSGLTITWAHWALKYNKRQQLLWGMVATIALGLFFLSLQAYEYYEAYTEMGLTLNAGIYGATFFMLTGFHGLHVTIGTIMLIVITIRCAKGHFTPERHFGFEATAWYWHFVDVVWLFLFIFVYWL